jgi:hypothetical protein
MRDYDRSKATRMLNLGNENFINLHFTCLFMFCLLAYGVLNDALSSLYCDAKRRRIGSSVNNKFERM